jgi:hypothetical protein
LSGETLCHGSGRAAGGGARVGVEEPQVAAGPRDGTQENDEPPTVPGHDAIIEGGRVKGRADAGPGEPPGFADVAVAVGFS